MDVDDEEFRGRSRSRSFVADDVDANEDEGSFRGRSRSKSFISDTEEGEVDEQHSEVDVSKAAALSKLYLKGSRPVDSNSKKKNNSSSRGPKKQSGALSAQALDALTEGLHESSLGKKKTAELTEEELEEKKMVAQEAKEIKQEVEEVKKTTQPTATSKASKMKEAIASRAASLKSSIFNFKNKSSASQKEKVNDKVNVSTEKTNASLSTTKKRYKLKILLLGDSGVGKTSLMRVLSGDPFSESMLATAGVDFKMRNLTVGDHDMAIQVWDTAGQERFHRITASYYKGADGIVLVYDVNDKRGFDNVGYWMNNIQQYSSPKIPARILVGNKIDLPNRAVSTQEGQAAADQYHCRFIETSAKTSACVEDSLEVIAKDALFLSIKQDMTQQQLIEQEKSGKISKENCCIS